MNNVLVDGIKKFPIFVGLKMYSHFGNWTQIVRYPSYESRVGKNFIVEQCTYNYDEKNTFSNKNL